MDTIVLLTKTVLLRPYVFVFLAVFLLVAPRLLGWPRTAAFFGLTWLTAFLCEFSSTRTGIPFGWYYYTGSTVGEELYLANVPFMDSLSFTFLLFASYCLALLFLLPAQPNAGPGPWPPLAFHLASRTSGPVLMLTVLFFTYIDVVIDPVALRGDRWFLGGIYGYPEPGIHFGVPIANYVGWAVVGTIALAAYFVCDRRLTRAASDAGAPRGPETGAPGEGGATVPILLGVGLYYGVLSFNLAVTWWIGEPLIALTGVLIFIPITVLLLLRLRGDLEGSARAASRSS